METNKCAIEAHLAHAVPGRIRLKLPAIRSDPEAAQEVRDRLSSLAELRHVEVNPASASVVLYYDTASENGVLSRLETLFDGFSRNGGARSANTNGQPAAAIANRFQRADQRIERATGVGLRLLVPLLLAGFALLALVLAALRRKKIPLPGWYDLFWFAFNTFIILNLSLPERDSEEK